MADLIETRRAEILLGDFIAGNISNEDNRVNNFLLAIKHPVKTLLSILSGYRLPKKRIYVSHPISKPRRMSAKGNDTGINEVNNWLKKVCKADNENKDSAFFYPLTIDELPLRSLFVDDRKETKECLFRRNVCWNLLDFFGNTQLLCDYSSLPKEIILNIDQVNLIRGMLKSDVRFRDLRLISQSRRLLVLNPWFNDKRPRGVRDEIDCALKHDSKVHIWQDPKHDTKGKCKENYQKRNGGTLDVSVNYIFVHDDLEAAIENVLAE